MAKAGTAPSAYTTHPEPTYARCVDGSASAARQARRRWPLRVCVGGILAALSSRALGAAEKAEAGI